MREVVERLLEVEDDLVAGGVDPVDADDGRPPVLLGGGHAGRRRSDARDRHDGGDRPPDPQQLAHSRLTALRSWPSGENISGPRRMPWSASFSANFGRTPVAFSWPR